MAAKNSFPRVFSFALLALVAIFAGIEVLSHMPGQSEPAPAPVQAPPVAVAPVPSAPAPPPAAVPVPSQAKPAPEVADAGPEPEPEPPPPAPGPEEANAAELMDKEPLLVLTGMDAGRDAAKTRDKDLLKRALNGGAWDAYRNLLARSIQAVLPGQVQASGNNRYDKVWDSPELYQALLRWKTIGCFTEADVFSQAHDEYTGAMWLWLMGNNRGMEELLLTISPKDDAAKVLGFMTDAWGLNTEQFGKYFPLAVACAVVFDQPMDIAHPLGSGGEKTVSPVKRYLWYVKNSEGGKLAAPVHHSSARDLVWVVCAPVEESEMDWAIAKMSMTRKHWGNAYGMIKYLMERAVNNVNPYKEYSFSEILKEGGICGDQSYFCVNTARAQGIPAMTIAGETNAGGHAWAGVKVTDDEWDTSIGRIGGAAKGQAGNPQTGEAITEQEILSWNDRRRRSEPVTLNVFRHLWLGDFYGATGQPADRSSAVHLANGLGRSFVETWRALYALLVDQTRLSGDPPKPENLDEWKDFAATMRREFRDNPRLAGLAATAETEYIFPYGTAQEAKRNLARERRRIERDGGEQKDLIADSLRRQADLIAKGGGPDAKEEICRLYDSALRGYGGDLTNFKQMAQDYFKYVEGDPKLARKAARDIELAFGRVVETGSKDWFRANAESAVYKMICGFYRSAGDTQKADQLEKRYELLVRRAKRGAL